MLDGAVWISPSLLSPFQRAATEHAHSWPLPACALLPGTHLKWLPILHTLMRVLSCIVCCHAILPHHLLSPINALWTQQWHIVAMPPILLAICVLTIHIHCLWCSCLWCCCCCCCCWVSCTRILCCWLCWGLAEEAKHALLAMFGSLACLPFPSALLSMLIPVKPIAELPLQPTTGNYRSSILTFQTECYPQSSSRHKSCLNRST